MNMNLLCKVLASCALLAAASCTLPDGADRTGEAASELQLLNVFYNPPDPQGTDQCTVSNHSSTNPITTTMHCCPDGAVMVGAHVERNVFKCEGLVQGFSGPAFLDTNTARNGMHACPLGSVMVGFHAGKNQLACRPTNQPLTFEEVDGRSNLFHQDSFPMHVCDTDNGFVMAGIHVDNNWFNCDR